MKYFTADLYARLQDVNDEQRLRQAHEDWEKAVQGYGQHLQQLAPALSPAIQRLLAVGSLHDSQVLCLGQGKTRLTILLRPDRPGAELLTLTYSLIEPPAINEAGLGELRSANVIWLYDEIARESDWSFDRELRILVPAEPRVQQSGTRNVSPVFSHDILLSNGWEVHLRFHRLRVERSRALLVRWPDSGSSLLTGQLA